MTIFLMLNLSNAFTVGSLLNVSWISGRRIIPKSKENVGLTSIDANQGKTVLEIKSVLSSINKNRNFICDLKFLTMNIMYLIGIGLEFTLITQTYITFLYYSPSYFWVCLQNSESRGGLFDIRHSIYKIDRRYSNSNLLARSNC